MKPTLDDLILKIHSVSSHCVHFVNVVVMGNKQHATKRSAQNLNQTHLCTPRKPVKSKIQKPNSPDRRMEEKDEEKEIDMREIQQMFTIMMGKLPKLDRIEADMKEIKQAFITIRACRNSRSKKRK